MQKQQVVRKKYIYINTHTHAKTSGSWEEIYMDTQRNNWG